MKQVYFIISTNPHVGSVLLRAFQIKNELQKSHPDGFTVNILHKKELKNKNILNSIFVWVKHIDMSCIKNFKNNVHIFDMVDNYVYKQKEIHTILNQNNAITAIIVNSNFMSAHIRRNTKYHGKIFVIHHHWDARLTDNTGTTDQLAFGYMGSIASLKHSDNFLHYRQLIQKYPIQLIDTVLGTNVTDLVKQNKFNKYFVATKSVLNPNDLQNVVINFNCHLSIRKNNTPLSHFKTTAKLATAAALSHNIITTREKAVMDILPADYPFLLADTKLSTICTMINRMIHDYSHGDKILWNKGLLMMQEVKNKLSIDEIGKKYVTMITDVSQQR